MNFLIFAGGSGTRLWPASRKSEPKQLLKFIGEDTLLQNTYKRIRQGVKPGQIFIATMSDYQSQVKKQLPEIKSDHYSLETARRNLGPALGLAMLHLNHYSKDKVFVTAWADHYIKQSKKYHQELNKAKSFIKQNPNNIVAVGVKPKFAHTGFRYINSSKQVAGSKNVFLVNKFTDKPNPSQAKRYLNSKDYLWNTGYFISTTDHILNLIQKYQPETFKILNKIKPYIGTKKQAWAIKKYYKQAPEFNFESILIKHPQELKTIKATFDWIDIGSWSAIQSIDQDQNHNSIKGLVEVINTKDSLIFNYSSKALVTSLNLKGVVVVVTDESILVADKNNSEDLKLLINKLKQDTKLKKYL